MPSPATRSRTKAVVVSAMTAALVLSGCGNDDRSTDTSPRTVAAAFYPLAWVAERVAGEHAEVTNLTTPGQEPHDLELGPRQVADVAGADLVIHLPGLQPAVDAAVEQSAEGAVLDVTEVVELRPAADHSEEAHAEEEGHAEQGHDHGDLDPHFWHDPLLMADYADAVREQLTELDPENATAYAANADAVRSELEALDEELSTGLESCERDLVVVNHDAFGYLARHGLHLEPITGLSPDAEPTAGTLKRIRDSIREEGITTVFSETLVSPKTAQTLAADAGVKADVLDPIEGLTDETAGEDYLSLMRTNLQKLQTANACD